MCIDKFTYLLFHFSFLLILNKTFLTFLIYCSYKIDMFSRSGLQLNQKIHLVLNIYTAFHFVISKSLCSCLQTFRLTWMTLKLNTKINTTLYFAPVCHEMNSKIENIVYIHHLIIFVEFCSQICLTLWQWALFLCWDNPSKSQVCHVTM